MNKLIGFASGLGGVYKESGDSPAWLLKKHFDNPGFLFPEDFADPYEVIAEICKRLAHETHDCVKNKQFFQVLSGDHSSAIGTWSGVRSAMADNEELGLIWIDAHLDAHTSETSPTGNIHGMPAAALLGYGDPRLIHIQTDFPKIKAENLCFIGIRSYEPAELDFIQQLNIRTWFMEEVQSRGLESVFQEALALVRKNTAKYGISLDLDAIDPSEAPGVSTPEKNGLSADELLGLFEKYALPDKKNQVLAGFEIAEFNHYRDIDGKTERLILKILELFCP